MKAEEIRKKRDEEEIEREKDLYKMAMGGKVDGSKKTKKAQTKKGFSK